MASFVNFDNFWEEARLFCHSQAKRADGIGFVLTQPDTPEALAWIDYAEWQGWDQRAKTWRGMLANGTKLTMPCANPAKFDPNYRPTRNWSADVRRDEPVTRDPEARRAIAAKIRSVIASARPPSEKRREDNEQPAMTYAELMARIAERNRTEPPAMSPKLAQKMGAKHEQAPEA